MENPIELKKFKSTQNLNEVFRVIDSATDTLHEANCLRKTIGLYSDCVKGSKEPVATALGEMIEQYETRIAENSLHYTDRISKILNTSLNLITSSDWKTTITSGDSPSHACSRRYESCRWKEISEKEVVVIRMDKAHKLPLLLKRKTVLTGADPQMSQPEITSTSDFRTANDELQLQNLKAFGAKRNTQQYQSRTFEPLYTNESKSRHVLPITSLEAISSEHLASKPRTQQQQRLSYGITKKSLGARRNAQSKFVSPLIPETEQNSKNNPAVSNVYGDERLKAIDPAMIELISNEIMSKFKSVAWEDIAGLEYAKATIQEAVVWPMLRPDIFTGLRRPPRGILLFGPPGTGKTLIGKCIASQSQSTFFSISASSLTSKWIGDGEKMVRALFAVAAVHQPSVIFIDEIDSLLCQRSETEHESSRRIKTEFLVQLDGAVTSDEDRILIIGATNRPQELDEAARRRFTRRLYIPLPEFEARVKILRNLLKLARHLLNENDIKNVGNLTQGYSGADMESLCREASMEPVRLIPACEILHFDENDVRPINFEDFQKALNRIRASVSHTQLHQYVKWNETYGSGTAGE